MDNLLDFQKNFYTFTKNWLKLISAHVFYNFSYTSHVDCRYVFSIVKFKLIIKYIDGMFSNFESETRGVPDNSLNL